MWDESAILERGISSILVSLVSFGLPSVVVGF
jgi:hypothetical protein